MSYGLVICSVCKREVHQTSPGSNGWTHCEDSTPRCPGAVSAYPASDEEIVGKYCGRDDCEDLPGAFHALPRRNKRPCDRLRELNDLLEI